MAQALINLNWKKKKGKVVVVGLTGPSGVGKTCLCDRLSQCLCKCQHSFFFTYKIFRCCFITSSLSDRLSQCLL